MKTAISLPDELFEKVEQLAEELRLSRSRIFTEAVRDYIARRRDEEILQALNRVYSETETKEEKTLRKQSKKHYARSTRWSSALSHPI